jgi:hypothetical protein
MQKILLAIAAFSVCAVGCDKKSANNAQTIQGTNAAAAPSSSPLTAPVDYLGALGKAKQTAEKTIDKASLNNAIQMFKVEQGHNPASLQELVEEKYLPRIPDAPYGMKIEYDAQSGTVKVVKK